jgi:hypothetical protein
MTPFLRSTTVAGFPPFPSVSYLVSSTHRTDVPSCHHSTVVTLGFGEGLPGWDRPSCTISHLTYNVRMDSKEFRFPSRIRARMSPCSSPLHDPGADAAKAKASKIVPLFLIVKLLLPRGVAE